MKEFDFIKTIWFLDLETTGPNFLKDRIVQLAMIKYSPNGDRTEWNELINPGIPISQEAYAVHKIDASMLALQTNF